MFKVGQKVVCVNDNEDDFLIPIMVPYVGQLDGLQKGEIYTIRAVGPHPYDPAPMVWLVEIVRPGDAIFDEPPFAAARFRPVQETGMEMLRAILIHPNAPVKEDA